MPIQRETWNRTSLALLLALGLPSVGCEPKARTLPQLEADAGEVTPQLGGSEAEAPAVTETPAPAGDMNTEGQPDVNGLEPEAAGAQSGITPVAPPDAGTGEPTCAPRPRDCSSELDNDCDGQPDNVLDDVCRCTPGAVEACDEHPGFDGLGLCRAGTRTCVVSADAGGGSSDWSPCDGAVAPGMADSCAIAGDDTDCDGLPNEGCTCVDGTPQQCGSSTDIGVCAFGTSTCVNGAFGQCMGAVPPAPRDSCAPGDDANCNGIPNEGCTCIDGETEPCGQDVGNCQTGARTCVNGAFGQCVGAIGAGPRDCTSVEDNDCDGRPDDTIDNVCRCRVGTTQACGTHPQDGVGACRAGSQQCLAGPNNASTSFGQCQGSVGPAAQDSCAIPGDDSNCNGTLNDNCIQPRGLGEPCDNAQQCETLSCEAFYVDADRDGYSPSLVGMQRLCSNSGFLPERTTRREPTNNRTTDCADNTNQVNPEQDQFFASPITGRSATDPLAFDYNCDGENESIYQSDTERSIAPGGAPTCTFAPFDLCNGGEIQRDSATCGQPTFVETCGPMDPQQDFPGLGCFSTDISASTVFCR